MHRYTCTHTHTHTHMEFYLWEKNDPPYRTGHSDWPSTVMYQSVSSGMKPATIACQKVCRAIRTVIDDGVLNLPFSVCEGDRSSFPY